MKPTDLRGILQYIPRYRDRVFVIAMDGAVVPGENFANLLMDIAVLRSLNIRVALVHGVGAQISEAMAPRELASGTRDGTGITDAETLEVAITAANRLSHEILEGLSTNDLRAACPNAVTAHPTGILDGVDHLHTGRVERVDVGVLKTLLDHDIIPVIPPLGFDGEGNTFRINSDRLALEIAIALPAVKLIYIGTQDGLVQQGQLLRQVPVSELEALLERGGAFDAEMLPKAACSARACRSGIPRVHILNGKVDEGLLAEVFSNEGVGTLVHANEYEAIRPALKKDIRHILKLIKPSVEATELIRRTRATIERRLPDYFIYEIDRNPVACVALHCDPESATAELASLCVSPSHENQGIGRKLLHFVERRARENGMTQLIALSTQAFNFFQTKAGFQAGSPENLPPARRETYLKSKRNSRILIKNLAPEATALSPAAP